MNVRPIQPITGAASGHGVSEGCRYLLLHLLARRRFARWGVPAPATAVADLTVALTTTPARLPFIYPTLNGLLDQTVRPRRIVLAVPRWSQREQRPYRVPALLRRQTAIEVLACDRDWGPATKLIPALRQPGRGPDDAVLAVDDDNIYPRRFVETFVRRAPEMPEAALSLRGWPMPASLRWRDSRALKGTEIAAPVRTDVITGCGGILVRPGFFDAAFFDYEPAPPGAFFVDDIWISGHLARRNVPKFVIPFSGPWIYAPAAAALCGRALDRQENRSGETNDRVIAYFSADWQRGAAAAAEGGPR
jgi:hypothetical protein